MAYFDFLEGENAKMEEKWDENEEEEYHEEETEESEDEEYKEET